MDECLTANANVATVLGSIPASSDTAESEGRQMETVLNEVVKKSQKSSVKKRKEKKVTQLSSILDCKNDKHTVYSTVHYPHHKKTRKMSLLWLTSFISLHIFWQGGVGEEGEVRVDGRRGGWVIYHLLGCVLPPPAHAEKTHNNKHSQDTELMDSWTAKIFEKRNTPS